MRKEDIKEESLAEQEDNRVIADMNIEGMPWYVPANPLYPESGESLPLITRKETLRLTFSALAAALLIALIFIGGFFLFIMFCIYVWF